MNGKRFAVGSLAILGMLLVGLALGQDQGDEATRQTVAKIAEALKAEDIERVMSLVDVPWYEDGEKRIIRERSEIQTKIEKEFAKEDFSDLEVSVKEVHLYQTLRPEVKDANLLQILDEVFTGEDRIVTIDVNHEGQTRQHRLGIRVRDGKLVGVGR